MTDRDLIDRAALVEFMERLFASLNGADISPGYLRGYKFALEEIKNAPRVEVQK